MFEHLEKSKKPEKEWCHFARDIRKCEMPLRPPIGSKICLDCMQEKIEFGKIANELAEKLFWRRFFGK